MLTSHRSELVCTSLYNADHRDGGLLLHPSGEYYSLGSSIPEEQLFVVSVTLSNPSNLPEVYTVYTLCELETGFSVYYV